ncbi:MAG: hypothetical protein IGS23_15395 [Rivularia sp. T60_A2020_040]|nr:hypothetical protein [Rivularia sp. T60_A2020_040]
MITSRLPYAHVVGYCDGGFWLSGCGGEGFWDCDGDKWGLGSIRVWF